MRNCIINLPTSSRAHHVSCKHIHIQVNLQQVISLLTARLLHDTMIYGPSSINILVDSTRVCYMTCIIKHKGHCIMHVWFICSYIFATMRRWMTRRISRYYLSSGKILDDALKIRWPEVLWKMCAIMCVQSITGYREQRKIIKLREKEVLDIKITELILIFHKKCRILSRDPIVADINFSIQNYQE